MMEDVGHDVDDGTMVQWILKYIAYTVLHEIMQSYLLG